MKKHFWKIAAAAIATTFALAVGTVGAAADKGSVTAVSAVTDLTGENKKLIIISQKYSEMYDKVFAEALEDEIKKAEAQWEKFEKDMANGILAEDPYKIARENANKRAKDECERLGLYNSIELTKVDDSACDYWRGYFVIDSIEDTQLPFSQPDRFSCRVGNRTATMISKPGYEGNYKKASVSVTYTNGETSGNVARGNQNTVNVTAPSKSGTIKTATYYFTMLDGTGAGAKISEMVQVTLVRRGYE